LIGNNNLAVSTTCHSPKDDIDAAYLPVQWGASKNEWDGGLGHCCFPGFGVEIPKQGGKYR
jgi:hypothetical protein